MTLLCYGARCIPSMNNGGMLNTCMSDMKWCFQWLLIFSNYESNVVVLLVVNVVLAKGIQIYQKRSLLAREILI